jgi:5-methylcytosine-specific restriction endonuclease McrA
MWILPKPLLEDALSDIARVISESNGQLLDTDAPLINYIYREYDRRGGMIENALDQRLDEAKRNALYNLYDKTQNGRRLSYIRNQLFRVVDFCPMCGIQPPSQLDHQMPRSSYKSLSVCRLNLVPICGVCNNKKNDDNPSLYIHPYYDHGLRDLPFFVIEIHSSPVTHRMSWKFSINERAIGDKTLVDKINHQIGVIKLFRRLYKETNNVLSHLLYGAENWTEETLYFLLNHEYEYYNYRLGPNDWHTVFMKSLIDSDKFTIEEAKVYAQRLLPANGGVNG